MKSDIEYAALVMGWKSACMPEGADEFRPEHDDGDSRRLEIACLNWIGRVMECPTSVSKAYAEYTGLVCGRISITPDNYRTAVFALAVEIGKVMEGKDNAE
jgi:hypothetical protein